MAPRETLPQASSRLIDRAGVADALHTPAHTEEAWIDVIHRMDEVYADLVQNQQLLEDKNSELEEAQIFIDSVLASMTDVLVVCDLEGRVVRANKAAEAILGGGHRGLEGRALRSIFAPGSALGADALLARLLNDGHIADADAMLLSADGAAVPLSVNCATRFDHLGRLVGFVLIGRPTGELRRAFAALDQAHRKLTKTQAQLVSAEKMAALGQLVAGVAHELNNPISFVFGNLHALKRYAQKLNTFLAACDAARSLPEVREQAETLGIRRIMLDLNPLVDGTLEGATRVSEIVQDLRRFSSSQKEQWESFNLVRVVQTAADWVTKSARSKPQLVVMPTGALEVRSLQRAVHQIVVNLVQNAVDVLAGGRGGRIEIVCGIRDRLATVAVTDTGPGLRPEHLSRVFEPFFTTKPVGEGTGLGLYVSYNLAQELGGRIDVENVDGGGARFTLSFPAEGHEDG
ncbi:PAS domain-containing sensor histidine kinase [Aestuariivirga litoralis]|uniref:histidine kinase n=1 Tax=Aestuariivirga litoralis TaxID=2650924 RepID=A0A2W2BKN2_9HYPH|nr:ATP-binding protein [Aestuariivirga litoralis]PZF76467.1 PAS domain-containing sensor histidine kinase [Aestuariivirga litoralis]